MPKRDRFRTYDWHSEVSTKVQKYNSTTENISGKFQYISGIIQLESAGSLIYFTFFFGVKVKVQKKNEKLYIARNHPCCR